MKLKASLRLARRLLLKRRAELERKIAAAKLLRAADQTCRRAT